MKAGETLYIPLPDTTMDSHLWMILNDPDADGNCVLVNFTSWRADKDQACVVEVGEHSYVRKRTCVNYRDAKICRSEALDALVAALQVRTHDPLSPGLLAKILSAVPQSRMKWGCVELLAKAGLLPEDA